MKVRTDQEWRPFSKPVAVRFSPVISEFYQRLRERGKPYSVALIACAGKMLVHLNTQLKPSNLQKSPAITATTT